MRAGDNRGRAYIESMVVVTMRGRWTIKRKRKEKEKTEGGREEEEEGPLEKKIWWSKGKVIYTEQYIPTRNQNAMPRDYLWWLGSGLGSELVHRLSSFRHNL